MPNEHKRSTEIFRCSLNSLRKFSIVFGHFWVPYIFFKFCPWNGRLWKTWRIIEKNKKGNFFPVHLDLNLKKKNFFKYKNTGCSINIDPLSTDKTVTVSNNLFKPLWNVGCFLRFSHFWNLISPAIFNQFSFQKVL